MQYILDHCNVALVILDFDKDDSVAHQCNDVCFTTALATDDLIDAGGVIDFDHIVQFTQRIANRNLCFCCCFLRKIWLWIRPEVSGFQPSVVPQDAHGMLHDWRVF